MEALDTIDGREIFGRPYVCLDWHPRVPISWQPLAG